MKRILNYMVVSACVAAWGIGGPVVTADDDPIAVEPSVAAEGSALEPLSTKYWIGIRAVPIDDALKSQLKLEDRLIAGDVIASGPAAEGGLKQHDILLKFGDREIKILEDLFKAVGDNNDKLAKVVVLRRGKKVTLEIQPAERPEDAESHLADNTRLQPWQGWLDGPVGTRFRVLGPGVLEDLPVIPGNLTISVTSRDGKPAKIIVKRDDDMWMITEDEIDQLPEDIREHVRRRIDHPNRRAIRIPGLSLNEEDGTVHFTPSEAIPEGVSKTIREQLQRAIDQLEKTEQRLNIEDPVKALQEEMKALRQEVEKLRERFQPAEPSATDA